jgi:phosphoglycerate dehydrogenase-like enzyme
VKIWVAHQQGVRYLGDLPPQLEIAICPTLDDLPDDPATVQFWSPPFLSDGGARTPALLARMTSVRVIQLMTAGAEAWIGRVPQGVTLCDARGVHDSSTSEWVLAGILAYLRAFPSYVRNQARGVWERTPLITDELAGKRVLIVGAGAIGAAIEARLLPFGVEVTRVARTARDGVHGVDELPGLLPGADIVVLIVPLTAATRGMVDDKFLAAMPDGALLVNAARGPVVHTDALVAEVLPGRLHAVLDVTDPEPLPAGHPLWALPNVLITPHMAGTVRGLLRRAYGLVGDQVRRYLAGEPLINIVTGEY